MIKIRAFKYLNLNRNLFSEQFDIVVPLFMMKVFVILIFMTLTSDISAVGYPNLTIVVTSVNTLDSYKLANFSLFVKSKNYVATLPTILYCFGYTENMNSSTIQEVMTAYQTRGGFNFLVADWSAYDSQSYFTLAQGQLQGIGQSYGSELYQMQNNRFIDLTTWHFIGHSLGAHVVGYIARTISQLSSNAVRIKRITGLDPAGPMLYDMIDFYIRKPLWNTDGKILTTDKNP